MEPAAVPLPHAGDSNARERALVDAIVGSVGEGLWVESGDCVLLNPEARRLLAVPEGVSPAMGDIPALTIEGEPLAHDQQPSVRARTSRQSVRFVIRCPRFDGEVRIFGGTASPVLADGAVVGTVCVVRDVTEEQTASYLNQCLLREGFNLLPTAISVLDMTTQTVLDCNNAFCELTGLDREQVVGQSPPFPWWAAGGVTHHTTIGESGRVEAVFRHTDGRPIPVELMRFHVADPNGGPGVGVALVTDLSDRNHLQQQLLQSGKLASIGELAAGVAHEINNPLFAILGLVEFLLREIEPGTRAHERLQLIDQTGQEIKAIVRALLDFARERSDELVYVYVRDAVTQTVELIRRTSANKGVEIDCVFGEEPAAVKASPNQLKQVFLNLLSNARQAMPEGGRVLITVDASGDDVVATVSDSGRGIPPEKLSRIFEPFYTTRRDDGGTGLGLSVSHGIVTAHGGTLSVESEPGVGTTFTMRLPRAERPS
jgi:PAS domain S-box-containing protein